MRGLYRYASAILFQAHGSQAGPPIPSQQAFETARQSIQGHRLVADNSTEILQRFGDFYGQDRDSNPLYEGIRAWYCRLVRVPPGAWTCCRSIRTTRLAVGSSSRNSKARIAHNMAKNSSKSWPLDLPASSATDFPEVI